MDKTSNDTNNTHMSYLLGVLLVLVAGVCWSTIGLGIRHIEFANLWQILLYRSTAIAVFLFVVIAVRTGGRPIETIRTAGFASVIGGCGLVLAFSGGIYSIQKTTVANAMFLFASAPFFAAVLGFLVLRESVRVGTWIAALVALLGIGIMVAGGFSQGDLIGNISALVAALGFAIFTVALRWGKLADMMPAVFLGGVFSLLTGTGACFLTDASFVLTTNDTLIALAMGVFQVGLGLVIFTIGSRVVPAAELALLSMTEVLLGPLWVWWFLGETADAYTFIGGAVLLLAIAGNALTGIRRKQTILY